MKLNRVNSKSLCWLIFGGSVAPRGPGAKPIPPGRPAVRLSLQVDNLFWPVAMLDQGCRCCLCFFAGSRAVCGAADGSRVAAKRLGTKRLQSCGAAPDDVQWPSATRLPGEAGTPPGSHLTSCCEICTDAVESGNRLQAIVHGNPRHRRPLLPSADGRPGELEGADVVRPR